MFDLLRGVFQKYVVATMLLSMVVTGCQVPKSKREGRPADGSYIGDPSRGAVLPLFPLFLFTATCYEPSVRDVTEADLSDSPSTPIVRRR